MNSAKVLNTLNNYRPALWLALIFLIFLAGVRFSDGSMLLAMASHATVADPVFAQAPTQYVWDSPLKVLLLWLLPANILVIALVFAALSALPAAGLLSRNNNILWLTAVVIFLTPALKVSVQNIGMGDGLMILLIFVAVYSDKIWLACLCFFLLALWHPQQSFFIGLSYWLALYCYADKPDLRKSLPIFYTLIAAAAAYLLYRSMLDFDYSGRGTYMLQNLRALLEHNIPYAPLAVLPLLLWQLLIGAKFVQRGGKLLAVWLLILAAISLLTTDVTRVITLISLPVVLFAANSCFRHPDSISLHKIFFIAVVVALIPVWSWSGLDYFLWPEFISDVCKWTAYCR